MNAAQDTPIFLKSPGWAWERRHDRGRRRRRRRRGRRHERRRRGRRLRRHLMRTTATTRTALYGKPEVVENSPATGLAGGQRAAGRLGTESPCACCGTSLRSPAPPAPRSAWSTTRRAQKWRWRVSSSCSEMFAPLSLAKRCVRTHCSDPILPSQRRHPSPPRPPRRGAAARKPRRARAPAP